MKLNEFVDKIYCINLERRPDRWERCQKIFNELKLDVERFSAVDGEKIGKIGKLKPGEVGVSRSNLEVVKLAKKNHYKRIVIFDDDIEFRDNFEDRFSNYIKEVPPDWSLIYFGGGNKRPVIPVSKHVGRLTKMFSAYAIIINSKVFDEIIVMLTKEERWLDVNYSLLQPRYPCYVLLPYLAWVRDDYSDIQKRELKYEYLKEYKDSI